MELPSSATSITLPPRPPIPPYFGCPIPPAPPITDSRSESINVPAFNPYRFMKKTILTSEIFKHGTK